MYATWKVRADSSGRRFEVELLIAGDHGAERSHRVPDFDWVRVKASVLSGDREAFCDLLTRTLSPLRRWDERTLAACWQAAVLAAG